MTEKANEKLTPGSLPKNHFAILFEGAWVFTPDGYDNTRILATCPLPDAKMHNFEFGLWKQQLVDVPGFCTTTFPSGGSFNVVIDPDQIRREKPDFKSVFDTAARRYPFVYLSPSDEVEGCSSTEVKRSQQRFVLRAVGQTPPRTVSIPIPTSVRAAGALTSAEVAGPGSGDIFGGVVSVKRTFVTFLFIYEYRHSLDADIQLTAPQEQQATYGSIHAEDGYDPHLLFKVVPAGHEIDAESKAMEREQDATQASSEDSHEKVHIITVFDQLRQLLVSATQARQASESDANCCDIMVYHGQGKMQFDPGDTGLELCELGLSDNCPISLRGKTLPACAGGGIVGSGA